MSKRKLGPSKARFVRAENSYEKLEDAGDEVVMVSSSSDSENEEPPAKKQKPLKQEDSADSIPGDAVLENQDFIGFETSSGDENEEFDQQGSPKISDSENEYLSNDETVYHTKSADYKTGNFNPKYPWIRNNDHSRQIEISDWLTMEIKDFIKYISPSAEEIKARNDTVGKLRECITGMWPDAEVHCFGSFATDLYLPGSDIDMVVVSKARNNKYDNRSSLYQLSSYIRNHRLGINVEAIAKAKVPIIKFVDPTTKIHIDISFERTNGIKAAELIISWLKDTPGLRELVLIVKQFLSVRKLNIVHTGGLGGFATICLVRSFLKLHPRVATKSIDPLENLGVLLIEFFELYGYNFGYDNTAIAFDEDGEPYYVPKDSNPAFQNRNPFTLAIQDPHDPANNISRGTFNLRDIKRSFGGAFELLVNKCYEMNQATYKERLGQSVLGDIIKYKGKQRDFEDARDLVQNEALAFVSGESSRATSLPPLPSEQYTIISDSDSESEYEKHLEQLYEKSQSKKPESNKNIDELMGLNDRESDVSSSGAASDSEQEKPSTSKLDKTARREYWLNKSGSF
ncbi:hypothetical protein KL906_004706 [Ogataea polymorpha]|uniref:polynucleotide adenylyltransferase n=1 Tax=Ogataea polymorpha TaxID=460523 RepID=A0A1B7SHP4_9ASCO|nr:uncharacterized protein OGAPODRAFT_16663 [Ogataea polymorpha]KAG7891366.1 hypothetical protein KL908_004119 [Ogataea polymorpha]KAG7906253.1 hypothetical protein KL906_004706 [Ogataea polymorpha]KAG7930636.1 hypothetical protein KL934_004709 [Ogataea polymorpha]KAH3678630.1 hypothetical protein OGATHE_000180 [Ogataea polymorpha]OBA15986.1 hypothetical protein OGAPODRAFT_16663 [Ogataea polymorpha]